MFDNEEDEAEETHAFRALSIPICSTSSVVSQAGRINDHTAGSTPISSEIFKISRVVPGTWVTIAASRCTALSFASARNGYSYREEDGDSVVPRMFRRLLLPTFGRPNIARRIPADCPPRLIVSHPSNVAIIASQALHRSSIIAQTIPRPRREVDKHAPSTYLPRTHPPQSPRPLQSLRGPRQARDSPRCPHAAQRTLFAPHPAKTCGHVESTAT